MTVRYEWRARFDNADLIALRAEGFADDGRVVDWLQQVEQHSLGWACAFDGAQLIGFVNVAWDGGVHAFVVDTVVTSGHRGAGVGRALVALAQRESRAAGCDWLHVDFEEALRDFYVGACGFAPTPAGLVALRG